MTNVRRIFISSTAKDLKEHRAAAARAIEQMGHKPEYFEHTWSARSGRIINECRRDAAEADAVVVIVAHRYGWVPTRAQSGDDDKSITWHEHDAAIAAGRPVFGFLVDEGAKWDQKKEIDRLNDECEPPDEDAKAAQIVKAIKRLKQFRALPAEKPCGFFSSPDTLATLVSTTVHRWLSHGELDSFRALADASASERAGFLHYLRKARGEWRQLRLAGIDPAHTDAEQPVRQAGLDSIYVGLNVVEPRPRATGRGGGQGGDGKGGAPAPGEMQDKDRTVDAEVAESLGRPWTALEACIHHHRIVILGGPGSGKTTFARMLGIELASRLLGGGEGPTGPAGRPWFDRPLAPVLVTIRDFAADLGEEDVKHRLVAFIERTLVRSGHADAWPLLRRMIRDGDALLMLDGLDEIARSDRRQQVVDAIAACAAEHQQTSILATCRVAAYTVHQPAAGPNRPGATIDDWRLDAKVFPDLRLASFNEAQQAEFIGSWYRELVAAGRIDRDPVERADSLRRAVRRRDLQRMAANPLLLTVMALVHASMGELPDQRVVLYSKAVETLLWRWQRGRAPGKEASDRESLQSLLDEADSTMLLLEKQLWAMARSVHAGHAGMANGDTGDEVADIPLQTLLERLAALHRDPTAALAWAVRLVGVLKHKTGLLIESRWGVFTFPHRTFQEYLAAREMATAADPISEALACRAAPNNLWREVILMVAGTQAHIANDVTKGLPLVSALLQQASEPGAPRRVDDLVLAADCLCEMTAAAVRGADGGPERSRETAEALLKATGDSGLSMKDRVRVAAALGRLGDPRPGVVTAVEGGGAGRFPRMAWTKVVAPGEFPMGNSGGEAASGYEQPRFNARIVEPFALSAYPITVGQYRMFVDAGGYRPAVGDRYWTHAGREWRQSRGITGPALYDEVFQTPNHPQVGVSWFEATAFCRWMAAVSGLPIRLPTEMEWERAARHTDAREYPWGSGKADGGPKGRANIDLVIGHSSAVGLFAGDCAECGALDMAGNVREWCQTRWTGDYRGYPPAVRLDDEEQSGARVLRGGSCNLHPQNARCAYRLRDDPTGRGLNVGLRVCVCPFSFSDL